MANWSRGPSIVTLDPEGSPVAMRRYPRLYLLDVGRRSVTLRVSDDGRFDRLDPKTGFWIHLTDPVVRDGLSRAIEGGDAWPTTAQ
jgi:hypothetical protein